MITEVSYTHSVTETTRHTFTLNNMVECNAICLKVTRNDRMINNEYFISFVSPEGIYLLRHYVDWPSCRNDFENIKLYAENHDVEQTTNFLKNEKQFNH